MDDRVSDERDAATPHTRRGTILQGPRRRNGADQEHPAEFHHGPGDRAMNTDLERWLALARTSRTRARIRCWTLLDRVMSERRTGFPRGSHEH